MKKVVGILLAAVLCVGTAMTAFAADSAYAGATKNSGSFSATGSTQITSNYDSADEQDAAAALKSDPSSALSDAGVDEDGDLIGLFNIEDDEYTSGSYTFTLEYDGATADGSYVVLQYVDGEWIQATVTAGDGYLTITTDGTVPIAIYDMSGESSSSSSDSSETSPTTGESSVVTYAVIIAVIAAAGAAAAGRKRRA